MRFKHKTLQAGLLAASIAFVAVPNATAAVLADGCYTIKINTSPVSGSGTTAVLVAGGAGTDGAWNSTFTFGGRKPNTASQPMVDNDSLVNGKGSGIVGDGFAGKINIQVAGASFTITSFNVDTIYGTAGGDFGQYGTVTGGGTINQTTGAMTLTPTGRLGTVSGYPSLVDKAWNIDNVTTAGATAWQSFTTGSASTTCSGAGCSGGINTINGHVLTSDGAGGWNAVLVTGGQVGTVWGGFTGSSYFETWNVKVSTATCPLANPVVSDTNPVSGGTLTTGKYVVIFDQAMDVATIASGNISVSGGVTVSAVSVTGDRTFEYTLSGATPGTTYTVTFNAGPKSSGGQAMTLPAARTFSVAAAAATAVLPIPSGGGAGGGCAYNASSGNDLALLSWLFMAFGYLGLRKKSVVKQ